MESAFIKSITFEGVKDSNEVYHGKKDYLNASAIKNLKVSPAYFKVKQTEKDEPSDAKTFGSAYHTMILELENFENEFYIFDDQFIIDVLKGEGSKSPRATNKYKEWLEGEMQEAGNRILIDKPTFDHIEAMRSVLHRHKYAKSLFSNGEAEKSFYCEVETNEGFSFKVKIRPDYNKHKNRIITDLKSAHDASSNEFARDAAKYNYHIQAALYSDIMGAITGDIWPFFFVAQEKTAPYAFNIFEAGSQFISQGRYEYEQLIRMWHMCNENDRWPGYQVFCENRFGVLELKLPAYSINEINFYNH